MANSLQNTAASESTAKLYLNETFADFHFVFDVGGEMQKIPANKANLAVLSPVFEKMFFGSMKESKEVQIVDAPVGAFKEFLQFFYLDEVTLTMENIEIVARLADKYDTMACVNRCAEFVKGKLTLDKICWGYQLAIFLKNEIFIELCEQNIMKSPKEMFASEGFRRCDEGILERILQLNLTCSETDVFDACMAWAKSACKKDSLDENRMENVRAQLGDNFKLIRFGEMTIEEFVKIDASYEELFTAEEFKDIMLQITRAEYQSKIFNQSHRCYLWDNAKSVECKRVVVDSTTQQTKSPEVVSFSSNKSILLGEIWSRSTSSYGCKGDVTITQIEGNTFHSNEKQMEVFKGKIESPPYNLLKIVLPKPILIKPQILYEIRVTGIPTGFSYGGKFNPKVKMRNGLEINFHRNPSLADDNAAIGWFSTLKFNEF